MKTYSNRYRPVGLGTIPRGLQWSWVEVPANYERPSDLPTSSRLYGVYTTERPLTPAELRDYEIDVIVDAEQAFADAREAYDVAYNAHKAADAAYAASDIARDIAHAAYDAAHAAAQDAKEIALTARVTALEALIVWTTALDARNAERANV